MCSGGLVVWEGGVAGRRLRGCWARCDGEGAVHCSILPEANGKDRQLFWKCTIRTVQGCNAHNCYNCKSPRKESCRRCNLVMIPSRVRSMGLPPPSPTVLLYAIGSHSTNTW